MIVESFGGSWIALVDGDKEGGDGLAKLYGVGLVDLQVYYEAFDANGVVLSGFAATPAMRSTNVATAPSSAT